jgi:hypothetical protein
VRTRPPNNGDISGVRLVAKNFIQALHDAIQFSQFFFGFFAPMPQ